VNDENENVVFVYAVGHMSVTSNLIGAYHNFKGELRSILTLSWSAVSTDKKTKNKQKKKQQKSVLPTQCYPLFKIRTLLTSMGHVLNLLLAS